MSPKPAAKPELISFKLCPFVQRSVITLIKKKADFDITFIDLENKPDWFRHLSPLGKVPVLKVGDVVLFESAVINEYLDEIYPPRFLPEDSLAKARLRAWVEFASALVMSQYQFLMARNEEEMNQRWEEVFDLLAHLEQAVDEEGPYFTGRDFTLVDAALAPAFMRFALVDRGLRFPLYPEMPRVEALAQTLNQDEAVKQSVVPDFEALFFDYLRRKQSHLGNLLEGAGRNEEADDLIQQDKTFRRTG